MKFVMLECDVMRANRKSTDVMIEVFPVILCHESEKREKSPSEGVEAGVAVVGVSSGLQTFKTIRTFAVENRNKRLLAASVCYCVQEMSLLFIMGCPE